jgi:hypothetical protein
MDSGRVFNEERAMNQTAVRITAVVIAIGATAAVSFSTESQPRTIVRDPSVPPAWEVLHANDGRAQDNVEDKTY